MTCLTSLPQSGSILSAKTPVRGRPHCSVRAGVKLPYSLACSPTTSRAGGPYATSTVPSLFDPPYGGHGVAVATSSCGGAASYGQAHSRTHRTCPPHAPPITDRTPGPTPCGSVADQRQTTDASRASSSTCSPYSSGPGSGRGSARSRDGSTRVVKVCLPRLTKRPRYEDAAELANERNAVCDAASCAGPVPANQLVDSIRDALGGVA